MFEIRASLTCIVSPGFWPVLYLELDLYKGDLGVLYLFSLDILIHVLEPELFSFGRHQDSFCLLTSTLSGVVRRKTHYKYGHLPKVNFLSEIPWTFVWQFFLFQIEKGAVCTHSFNLGSLRRTGVGKEAHRCTKDARYFHYFHLGK